MSEEKKIEPGTEASGMDNSNLIADPKPPVDDIIAGSKDKSGFKGTATDEEKSVEESALQKSYKALEEKLGTQGEELGDYRKFFKEISPLLDKLDTQPELIQAIIDGKVDTSLAKAAINGKISIQDAKTVTEAHKEIKKEVGEKKYKELSPEEIEQKITERVSADVKKLGEDITKDVKRASKEAEEKKDYSNKIDIFIKDTKDFPEYANDIYKWLDENPNQDDIKIAYSVVKGIALQKKAEELSDESKGEDAKKMASNASGGGSQGTTVTNDKSIVDELIGGKSNPNVF